MSIRQSVTLAGLVLLSASLSAQSLGDVARAQRQKQSDKTANPAHKVITDEDIPSYESAPAAAKKDAADKPSNDTRPLNTEANGEELKAKCLSAKRQIKDYQEQIDKLRAASQLVEANRYSNGVEYNQQQLRKQQEADRMQKQLEIAKQKFADLQQQARKAGFGSSVYDP